MTKLIKKQQKERLEAKKKVEEAALKAKKDAIDKSKDMEKKIPRPKYTGGTYGKELKAISFNFL